MQKFIIFLTVIHFIFTMYSYSDDMTSNNDLQSDCMGGTHEVNLWDKCKIPFYINSNVPSVFHSDIQAAFDAWTSHTGITFKLKQLSESNIIFQFKEITGEDACNSVVGLPYAFTDFAGTKT